MFRQFGWPELVIVLVIALLIFGPSKLPQLAESIGKTIRQFRKSMEEAEEGAVTEEPTEED
jgi:sec-independent protein translocase protein TatA